MNVAYLILRYVHITAGFLALGAGAGALICTKGSPMHRQMGKLFFVSMMVLAAVGLYISIFVDLIRPNILGSSLTLYITATAWLTVWREPAKTGRLEIAAALFGLAVLGTGVTFGVMALKSPSGQLDAFPAPFYFIFSGIALLGITLDARMIARGGLTGAARTTRHLWRMCFAMFFATASFFAGQARQFTPMVRESGALQIPIYLMIAAFLYFLIRVRVWPLVKMIGTRHTGLGTQPSVEPR